jgi:hypothetical protein
LIVMDEWILVGVIVAAPIVVWGAIEAYAFLRRRRAEALARRPKGRRS